ncbi:hypothetical protein JYU34_022335 [Plutella xylostella]|uniref:FP protein C-terminal domain-containing protein n=1 Tax=Plutella xylostella TaxID=51655 RepID=A0ABQ7PQR4_PLUXY|nr:hypothetical protein JYU34_022335 [Plutella xylostella]
MPINRSPPPPVLTSPHMMATASEPDLSMVQERDKDNRSFTMERRKGKRNFDERKEEELSSFMEEIRTMISSSAAKQQSEFQALQASLKEIKYQNDEINKAMTFLSEKYEEMRIKLEVAESEKTKSLTYIKELEERVENLEKNSRSSSIEIRNIPAMDKENKEDLTNILKEIGKTTDIPIDSSEIRDIFRIKTKSKANPIIVEFTTVPKKETLLTSLKKCRHENKRISTSLLKINGPDQPIYISENLTTKGKRLHYLAREFAQANNWKFCWIAHGHVYLRKMEGATTKRINSEADLQQLLQ